MSDLKGFNEHYGLNSRLVKRDGRLVEEVYKIDGRYAAQIGDDREAPRSRNSVRVRNDGHSAACAHSVVPHRRGRGSRQVRHRLGGGQGLPGRHHQRLHRGLHGRARHQGLMGGARLLRQPGQDRPHPDSGRQRSMVRGPDAVEPRVPQAHSDRHRRECDRRCRRDGRFGSRDAGRDQPAERPEDSRTVRQQVDLSDERS